MPAFLLEIGLEEIPASMIPAAQAELEKSFRELIVRERLAADDFEVKSYSTPRRLAIVAEGLLPKQADMEEEVVGPSVKVAYKDGAPTPAATAFAKKNGVEVSTLRTIQNAKGEYIAVTVRRAGRSVAEVLSDTLPVEIAGIHWPKNMYWRAGKPERFVRPVRWLLALLDEEVLPVNFAGIVADGVTFGHRVLCGDTPVAVRMPKEYVKTLRAASVEVDVDARRQRIRKALDAATRQIAGARWREDEALIEVVTHLTEWPGVVLGGFDASYLDLPEEVLVTVMRDHQKYFALEDANGKLLPNFLAVLNIEADADGVDIIRHGNERVLRARFNDARFFWDVDQRIPLVDRVEMLKNVTFQKELGSYWDKTQAILAIATSLANTLDRNARTFFSQAKPFLDHAVLRYAAELAKTDLTTELVKEFTELQGIIGGLYAEAQGLGDKVATAIYTQYMPASITDPIPYTDEGLVLGLADRMHTVTAMFQLGLEPTGSRDPFALRRAGNAIAKIMVTSGLSAVLKLSELIEAAVTVVAPEDVGLAMRVRSFLQERIAYELEEVEHISAVSVKAAMTVGCDDVRDALDRAKAVEQMRSSADFLAISSAFKRIRKILEQARENGETIGDTVDRQLFHEQAEKDLDTRAIVVALGIGGSTDYIAALEKIAALRPTVDTFFDQVMVMAEDVDLKRNRLSLLQFLYREFTRIADFSLIASE